MLARSLSQVPSRSSRIESLNPQVRFSQPPNPRSTFPWILGRQATLNPRPRCLSSAPALEHRDHDLVAEILSKPTGPDEVKAELDALNLSLDDEGVNSALRSLEGSAEAARRFFDWVSERENQKLRSKSYNIMIEILGRNARSDEFWGLVETMKRKGYGISKGTFSKLSESFKNDEMEADFDRLKETYSHENVVGGACTVVCKILREENDAGEIQNKLQDLGINLSSDLVITVLEHIGLYPKKALVFFRWLEENPSFKIEGKVYNSMARVLGHEDCMEEFRDVLHKMRNAGYKMEMETYIKVSGRFHKRRMVAGAVDLYEFAMCGSEKPSLQDFMFLLKKIVVSKDPEMDLISRVVRVFVDAGNSVKKSTFNAVLKSLRSVGKLGECDKILKAMEKGGFVADSAIYDRVISQLCDAGRLHEACEYIDGLEKSGCNPSMKAWTSLVQKHSLAGELDRAVSCFRKMVERKGGENVGCAFEALVNGLCQNNRVEDAFKILKEMVTKKNLQPWHSTYKFMIERLLSQGRVKEACTLLGSMKNHGFPPFIDPFIGYISKTGTVDDAMGFLKAMTVKEFPSREVFVRMFKALLKAGRHDMAHNVLSKSPGSVRNHVDVLNLFYSMKPDETVVADAI